MILNHKLINKILIAINKFLMPINKNLMHCLFLRVENLTFTGEG